MSASLHPSPLAPPRIVGRYALYEPIASGGMATVHFGRMRGPAGFGKTVAIKRLHPQFALDPEFVAMFLDEARLAARVHHPNVVSTLDVVAIESELFLVMEYVRGQTLARLAPTAKAREAVVPLRVAVAIVTGALHGLHAAHEAKDELGRPLGIVHRDVSPQNVIVGADGAARVLDFGVAKAVGLSHVTREGQIKGKLAYMPPEQLRGHAVTRKADIYAASVVLWQTLTGRRLFQGDNEGALLEQVLHGLVEPPSRFVPSLPQEIDDILMRGLSREPDQRFETAREMARALEAAVQPALASEVGEWVEATAAAELARQAERIAMIEASTDAGIPEASTVAMVASGRGAAGGSASRASKLGWLAVAIVAAAVGAFAMRALSSAPSSATPPPQSAVAIAIAAPSASATVPVAQTVEPVPSAQASASAPAARAFPPRAAPARSSGPPPADECSPPYTVDSAGHVIFKPQCH